MKENDPKIFDTFSPEETVPEGFSAVKIVLDGRVETDLNWEKQKKLANQAIGRGLHIFWEIHLGLLGELPHPLTFESQVRTLQLALQAFQQEIWTPFSTNSLGLCLYRGTCDFTLGFPWLKVIKGEDHHDNLRLWLKDLFQNEKTFSEETGIACLKFSDLNYRVLLQNSKGNHLLNLFCRNVLCDYLDLLTMRVPDEIPLYLLLDAQLISRLSDLSQLLSRERFSRYHLAVRGGGLPLQGMAWDDNRATVGYISHRPIEGKAEEFATTALCLPPAEFCRPSQYEGLEEALQQMNKQLIHYRIIPEPLLISEWQGLDHIIVLPKAVSDEGKRMLQGFCAAGGEVVTIGEELGLPQELTFSEWTEKLLEIL